MIKKINFLLRKGIDNFTICQDICIYQVNDTKTPKKFKICVTNTIRKYLFLSLYNKHISFYVKHISSNTFDL